jgi:integrase/recombinase XerD
MTSNHTAVMASPVVIAKEVSMGELRDRMERDMRVRDFSVRTIEAYVAAVRGLAKYYRKAPDTLSDEEIHRYLIYVNEERKLSASSRQQIRCGLRFFYDVTVRRPQACLAVPPARQPQKLPEILSREEVSSIIASTRTLRERLMLMRAYGGGLRVSEVVHLRWGDLDRQRGLIRIEQGKGNKDRYTVLPRCVVEALDRYRTVYPTQSQWIFSSRRDPQRALDATVVQKVYGSAKRAASVYKHGGIHALRHAFATHPLELGCDLPSLQRMLGHTDVHTTMRYLHVTTGTIAQRVSPLDQIVLAPPVPRR